MKGEEESTVSSKSKTHGSHTFVHLTFPLTSEFQSTGKVPMGQHEYPFTVRIPADLPSTFSHSSKKGSCRLK